MKSIDKRLKTRCLKCGKQNREGASYCTECGSLLPKKAVHRAKLSRRAKRIAAAVLQLTIAAAIIVFFAFLSGTSIEGQWYSEDEFSVLEFKGGQAQITDLSGTQRLEYEYDRHKGEGRLTIDGKACAFSVEKNELTLQSPEKNISFSRAKEEVDTEKFVKEGLLGLWSNEKTAQVLELKGSGDITVYSIEGERNSVYDYDIGNGKGSFTADGKKAVFSVRINELDVDGTEVYVRQNSGFDIPAFIEKYGNPLKGVWYDASGIIGKFSFQAGGRLFVTSYGKEYQGTYTFSNAEGRGSLSFGGIRMDIVFSAGSLKIRGQAFTRNYIVQKGRNDVYGQLIGIWYDKLGSGTIRFSADGTAVFERNGESVNAECEFNPLDGSGTIKLNYTDGAKSVNILLSNGVLAAGEWLYIRDAVEQKVGITGSWKDSDGRVGTLTLKAGGNAELIFAGSTYSGTYSFDAGLGKGTITTVYNGKTWTFDMELMGERLVIRTGILLYDEITFTRQADQKL